MNDALSYIEIWRGQQNKTKRTATPDQTGPNQNIARRTPSIVQARHQELSGDIRHTRTHSITHRDLAVKTNTQITQISHARGPNGLSMR